MHPKFLLRNGADEIVYPERQLADWTAIRYTADHILDYIELDSDHAIIEIAVPEKWIGKTVIEADVRKKHGINIMAIKRDSKMNLNLSEIQTSVVWKKASSNALVNSFSDLLLSNQAAINAEYVK